MDNQQESVLLAYPLDKDYLITLNGEVLSNKYSKQRKLKPYLHYGRSKNPYLRLRICGKLQLVHRVVASAMIGRELQKDEQVNHLNGVTTDNRVFNLEVLSHQENVKHAVDNHLYCSGEDWYKCRV